MGRGPLAAGGADGRVSEVGWRLGITGGAGRRVRVAGRGPGGAGGAEGRAREAWAEGRMSEVGQAPGAPLGRLLWPAHPPAAPLAGCVSAGAAILSPLWSTKPPWPNLHPIYLWTFQAQVAWASGKLDGLGGSPVAAGDAHRCPAAAGAAPDRLGPGAEGHCREGAAGDP